MTDTTPPDAKSRAEKLLQALEGRAQDAHEGIFEMELEDALDPVFEICAELRALTEPHADHDDAVGLLIAVSVAARAAHQAPPDRRWEAVSSVRAAIRALNRYRNTQHTLGLIAQRTDAAHAAYVDGTPIADVLDGWWSAVCELEASLPYVSGGGGE